MKNFKSVKYVMILSVLIGFSILNAQDPAEIIRNSHDALKISSFEAVSTLTIHDGKGNQRIRQSSMASMSFPDGTEKRIIKFLGPAEVKGTGILIFDYPERKDDMWIYLPALRKTRRIVSSEKSKGFMGSEFSNADMTAPGLNDFSYKLLGEGIKNGEDCWKIESTPISIDLEDEYGYSKSVSWISKNDYIVHETEYYDFDGKKIKTIKTRSYKLLEKDPDKYMVTSMVAENHENGRMSEMVMDRAEQIPTKTEYFTVTYLERQ
ncbi:MAG TPA: outer membrane lipoprotein-sorting protein [Bacteroidaceae bacterium]|nr:outer membrane lipoprotein-sorting protein [Bacteroidaceae bacterium]